MVRQEASRRGLGGDQRRVFARGDSLSDRFRGAIFLNNEKVGTGQDVSSSLPPGKHVIRVRRSGYQTITRAVVLKPGESRTEEIEMQTTGGASSTRYRRWR
jgi:hypothetical protein